MSQTIDARAMVYPMPIMMAQKALSQGCTDLTVLAGDIITVESLVQLAGNYLDVSVAHKDGCFAVIFREKQEKASDAGETEKAER